MIDLFRRNRKALALVAIALTIWFLAPQLRGLSTVSQYQGIHPSFVAVYYNGTMYTAQNPGAATLCRIHPASVNFDPDWADMGHPNLRGELRDVQIVRDLGYYEVQDTAAHIISMGGSGSSPYKTYTWEAKSGEDTHKYRMELWLCSLQVNLWADPDARPWWIVGGGGEQMGKKYSDVEVWLRMEVGPDWYFEGADRAYFGLAYMELAEFSQLPGHEDPAVEVIPESKWAAFSIYDGLDGSREAVSNPVSQARTFQGKLLNPEVFRDEWYVPITVDNFGSFGYNVLTGGYNTNSVQLKVLVHVFVVGEWVVKPDMERDMEQHESTIRRDWMQKLGDWLSSPWTQLGIGSFFTILLLGLAALTLWWFVGPPRRRREE